MPAAIDQFRQPVARQPHHRRARDHRLEIDLAPRVVEHRLHQQRRLAIEALQLLPWQMGAELDASLSAARRRGYARRRRWSARCRSRRCAGDLERLEQQHAALGLEKCLATNSRRRPAKSLARARARSRPCPSRPPSPCPARGHSGRSGCRARRQPNVKTWATPLERLALGLFKARRARVRCTGRVDMMALRKCPGVVAVEIVLHAVAAVGQQIERAGVETWSRRLRAPARRPARRAGGAW